jgi:hypothetical protein
MASRSAVTVVVLLACVGGVWALVGPCAAPGDPVRVERPQQPDVQQRGTESPAAAGSRRRHVPARDAPAPDVEPTVAATGPDGPAPTPERDVLVVHVSTRDGAPVAGVPVVLSHTGRYDWGPTDGEGRWRTRRPAREATVYPHVERPVGGRWFFDASTTLAPGTAEARIVLTEAARVRARVVDPEGDALEGLEIEVVVPADDSVPRLRTSSGQGGEFEVLVPVHVHSDLVLTGRRHMVSGSVGDKVRVVAVSPWEGRLVGVSASAEDLVLRARHVPLDGELDVRVHDPFGGPVPGVPVQVSGPDTASIVRLYSRSTSADVTDRHGRVWLSGLDRRLVRVWTGPAPPADVALDWLPPAPVEVLPRGQEVTLVFRAAAPVAGHVVYADNGDPVVDAWVFVHAADAAESAVPLGLAKTGSDGAFRVLVPLDAPRDLRVTAIVQHRAGRRKLTVSGVAPGTVGLRFEVRR